IRDFHVTGVQTCALPICKIGGLHFVPDYSLEVYQPPRADLVVAEVLGNFAYEEGMLETLRDAHRFLAPGGTLIPQSIVQWAVPRSEERRVGEGDSSKCVP